MQQELKTIHCYDAVSFVIEVEKAVKEGFSLDLVTPQNYPQQIGFQFITTMVKDSVEDTKEAVKKESLTVKIDASEVQSVVDKAVEDVKSMLEASKIEQVVQSTSEEIKAAVEAPKKAETATQDIKAKPGRPAKAK